MTRPPLAQRPAWVQGVVPVAPDSYVATLAMAADFPPTVPGQFVHLRLGEDPLLRRPLSLLSDRVDGGTRLLEVMFAVVGRGTRAMAVWQPGDEVDVLGPCGNGFALPTSGRCVLVAGGRGVVPLYRVVQWLAAGEALGPEIHFIYGARTAPLVWGLERLGAIDVAVATDDGSLGHHGTAVDLLERALDPTAATAVLSCGPEPFLAAVAQMARRAGVEAQVSLENRMGCAAGLCRGCVIPRRLRAHTPWPADGNAAFGTVCREGPVFWGNDVEWRALPVP